MAPLTFKENILDESYEYDSSWLWKSALVAILLGGALFALLYRFAPIASHEDVSKTIIKYGCTKTNNFVMRDRDTFERLYRCHDGIYYPYSDIKDWSSKELRESK